MVAVVNRKAIAIRAADTAVRPAVEPVVPLHVTLALDWAFLVTGCLARWSIR